MPNRSTRDEIIRSAIRKVRLPNLEYNDMPEGVVKEDAFCIDWLQEIVDFWHHIVPFSATIQRQPVTCLAGIDTIIAPDDFIVDVRNGLMVQTIPGNLNSFKRAGRLPLQKFLDIQLTHQGAQNVKFPWCYCVAGDDNDIMTQRQTLLIAPTPTNDVLAELWYYKLPPRLTANQRPKLPNDYIPVEYVRLRALEWANIAQPGTAHAWCTKLVQGMKAGGLLNEPETDSIPFDETVFTSKYAGSLPSYAWMGER